MNSCFEDNYELKNPHEFKVPRKFASKTHQSRKGYDVDSKSVNRYESLYHDDVDRDELSAGEIWQ